MKLILFTLMSAAYLGGCADNEASKQTAVVSVRTEVVGASADVVETDVTAPLENALFRERGVKVLRSQSRTGHSEIDFQAGAEKACDALSRLIDEIADVRKRVSAIVAAPSITASPEIRC